MSTNRPLPGTNPLKRLLCISVSPQPADAACCTISKDTVEIDLTRAPELKAPGGALRLEDKKLADRILVVHGLDGRFRAFRNRCACGGFRIDPVPGEEKIRCCTLMQSTYDYTGKRLSGTARKDLDLLNVAVSPDRLSIALASLSGKAPHARK